MCVEQNSARESAIFSNGEIWSFVTRLSEQNVSATNVLDSLGLTLSALLDPSHRVTLAQMLGMHRFARSAIPTGLLEIDIGSRQHLTAYGTAGFAAMSSPTLEVALGIINRLWPLFNSRFSIVQTETGGATASLRFVSRFHLADDILVPSLVLEICKIITILKDIFGPGFVPERIGLPPLPNSDLVKIEAFAGCAIAPSSEAFIGLPAALLRRPLLQAHEITHRLSLEECERMVVPLRRLPALVGKVRAHLSDLTDGTPSLTRIAKQLGMSERTLRRRLQDLGTSYSAIVDEVRFTRAKLMLMEASMTTEVIAEQLGYTETSNFRHAFRRWAGHSPRAFRDQRHQAIAA